MTRDELTAEKNKTAVIVAICFIGFMILISGKGK